jgi:hypothetical protein
VKPARERISAVVAALVCVVYASSLRDVVLYTERPAAPEPVATLPPPTSGESRDGRLQIEVTDERGALVEGAEVRVFAIRDEQALLATTLTTDDHGVASGDGLPVGEAWVLGESEGRQRASTRVVIEGGAGAARGRVVKLVLRRANTLRVQVIDDEQRAVVGASIEVRGGDPLPYAGRTRPDGVAEIGRLGPPPWSVRASSPGYEPVSRAGLGAGGLLPQRIVLRALSSLEVSVVNEGGSPAEGAEVLVSGAGLWPARSARSDALGIVKIGGLPAGAYEVAASLGELVSATSYATPVKRGENNRVKLTLGQGRRVAVRVVDGEGELAKPIAGASVVLAEEGLSPFPKEAVTGPDGGALLGPVSSRQSSISARAEGFVARTGVQVPAQLEGPVIVALVRGATLAGQVVDTRDYPVDGATIEVIGVDLAGMPVDETPENIGFRAAHFAWALPGPRALLPQGELGVMPGPIPRIPHGGSVIPSGLLRPGGSEAPPAPWVSSGDGTFRATPVPPGRLRALVRHPGYVEALSDAVTVGPGGEGTVRVVMRLGGTLEGRLVDQAGHPVAGARIEIAAVHGTLVRSALSADDGSFAFAAVPGEISVSVARAEAPEEIALRKTLSFKEGEKREIELQLPEAREPISVRVLDDRGYPLDAVQITALSLAPSSPLRETRFTRSDGVALLPDAAGLPLRLEISLNGHAPLVKVLEPAGPTLEVTLRPASAVTGEITARGGREPVGGAEVLLRSSQGLTRRTRTDDDGHFTLRDLPPGPARLSVAHKGHARRELTVTIPEPDPGRPSPLDRIELEEAGTVEGDVVDKDDNPVVGARVALGAAPAYLPLGVLPDGIAVTDAQGRFSLPGLPEGEASLEAYAPELGRGRAAGVRVVAGRVVRDIRIRIDTAVAQAEPASSGGVAVTLGEAGPRGKRTIVVHHVAPGSEAERAGLLADDVLARIDDHAPASLEEARRLLSGPVGEDVVLRVLRENEELPFRVPRERVRR